MKTSMNRPPQLGVVKGKGTSTSDSIPAKLSKGEVVIPAAVVKRYGADYFKKLISSVVPELGAKTSVKKGVLHAAGGYYSDETIDIKPAIDPRDVQPTINVKPAIDANAVRQAKTNALRLDTMDRPSGNGFAKFNASANNFGLKANDLASGVSMLPNAKGIKAITPVDNTLNLVPKDANVVDASTVQNFANHMVNQASNPKYKDWLGKSFPPAKPTAVDNYFEGYIGMPAVPALGKAMTDIGSAGYGLAKGVVNSLTQPNESYKQLLYGEGNTPAQNLFGTNNTAPNTVQSTKPVSKPASQLATKPSTGLSANNQGVDNSGNGQYSPFMLDTMFKQNTVNKPVANKPVAPSQQSSLNVPAGPMQYNIDGTKTPLNNSIPGGRQLPLQASDVRTKNGGSLMTLPSDDNRNAYQLGITPSGTDSEGRTSYNIKSGNGGSGSITVLPGLNENFKANKGGVSFFSGGLPASKGDNGSSSVQQPQQQFQPYLGEPQDENQDYRAMLENIILNEGPNQFMGIGETRAANQRVRNAKELLGLVNQNTNSKRNADVQRANLINQKNEFNQRMAAAKTQEERDAIQQQFNNGLAAQQLDYTKQRDEANTKAATTKAQKDYEIEQAKLNKNEYGALQDPQTGEMKQYPKSGIIADNSFKLQQQAQQLSAANQQTFNILANPERYIKEVVEDAKAHSLTPDYIKWMASRQNQEVQ